MKKFMAILLVVLFLFAFTVPAFAAEQSPTGEEEISVTIFDGTNSKPQRRAVKPGESVSVQADRNKGKFDNWAVYKPDGSVAKVDVDYVISEGSLTSENLTIVAKTDVIVTGNYNKVVTDPLTGNAKVSPKTGETVAFVLVAVMMAAAGICFVSKKQLCK